MPIPTDSTTALTSVPPQPVPQQPTGKVQPQAELVQTQQPHEEVAEFSPSPMDLMYMMACYCYINASKIGYQALKELNPNFVVVNSLKNPEILRAVQAGSAEIAQIDKNEQAIEAGIGTADTPNGASMAPGVPSDNARNNP
jgi:hypothetical protein